MDLRQPDYMEEQTTTLDASQQLSFIVIEGKAKERNFGRQTPGDQRFIKKAYHF